MVKNLIFAYFFIGMKVLKFGGTSVGTVESLLNVKGIVENIPGNAVIVVSALGGLTDKLISTTEMAAKGDDKWLNEWEAICERHFNIIKNVIHPGSQDETIKRVTNQLIGLKRNFEGVALLRDLPQKTLDTIVSFGERMSSVIVADMIKNGKRYFSPDFIKTEKRYGRNINDSKLTEALIKETFSSLPPHEKAIVPGFISTDSSTGEITNLGRGGSDFTGALLAAALGADSLEIWTDVDGFMSADPRIVNDAFIIPQMSFAESMELCNFGAKVIYPPTIYPVFHKNIPIKILNTFNPEGKGTLISDSSAKDDREIKGVTALKGLGLVTLKIDRDQDPEYIKERAFNVLSRHGVRIITLSSTSSDSQIEFAVTSPDIPLSLKLLRKEFTPEIQRGNMEEVEILPGFASLAIVGKDMKQHGRLAARIINSLDRNNIPVKASSVDNTSTLLFLIEENSSSEAISIIHSLIFIP